MGRWRNQGQVVGLFPRSPLLCCYVQLFWDTGPFSDVLNLTLDPCSEYTPPVPVWGAFSFDFDSKRWPLNPRVYYLCFDSACLLIASVLNL
ncbi:hypothetical protein TNCT_377671 [Trichonephila clavata]|uniref:Uncharacterized protein n=1 Tax=Trichonephila clavata TaxID=2740835 RepID=A0A8X6FKJ0_TRICU|nr:hypothetical protein TNCT_377671 [Trichonephila clavata]